MTDDARKQLSERLRQAREDKGLSQEQVAEFLGIPRPAISQIENGNRRVEAIELVQLSKFYDQPLSFFSDDKLVGANGLDVLHRMASKLSDEDRDQVLRFAEFLKKKADDDRKSK